MDSFNGKLVMSFDCLNTKSNLKNAILSAKAFSDQLDLKPEAVSVVGPSDVKWPNDFTLPWRKEFEKLGQLALVDFLKHNHGKSKLSTRVLLQPYRSSKENVRLIVKDAAKTKASAIAVFTHVHHSGFALPGSFITSLIYESGVPILVVNAEAPAIKSMKRILFATDFSLESARAFRTATEIAKKTDAKIILLHILPTSFNETMAASAEIAGGWGNVEAYLKEEDQRVRKKGAQWARRAKDLGVDCTVEVSNNSIATHSAILDSAKRNQADLIVMTQRIGRWSSYVLGSVTRDVIGKSVRPVLVVPSRAVESRDRKKERK